MANTRPPIAFAVKPYVRLLFLGALLKACSSTFFFAANSQYSSKEMQLKLAIRNDFLMTQYSLAAIMRKFTPPQRS
jgi:hypothetical protein